MPPTRNRIYQLPLIQWLAVESGLIVLSGLVWMTESRLAGYSALIGGLIFVVPNAYFARQM